MGETATQFFPRTLLEVWESLPEGTNCQIISNALIMSPAPVDEHQKVVITLSSRLFIFAEENDLGQVRHAPYDVHFDEHNVYQPDILYISKQNLYKIEGHFYGAPDLIIEVLSPSTANYDKMDKKDIYERYGVKEYFIIDPSNKNVVSYLLINDEFVQRDSKPGVIESKLLNASFAF